MSFNEDDLTMLVLGIQGDEPVDPAQPPLPEGNHLRWFPSQDRGFPWFGFYLFRRESRPSRPRCLSIELRRLRPGTYPGSRLDVALGRLISVRPLVFTEQFPAADTVEVDLSQGGSLRFELPSGADARRVDLRIGFRDAGPQAVRTCVDFRPLPLGIGPSPRTEKGVVFTTAVPPISPVIPLTAIEQWPGSPAGLQTSRRLEIELPCPARRVDLRLTNRGELRIEAFRADGKRVALETVAAQALAAGIVTLAAEPITLVVVESPTIDPALLHEICFECPAGHDPDLQQVEVRGLAGDAVVAQANARGKGGEVAGATLEAAAITAVEIGAANAALVDLCVWPRQQGVTYGWDEVPGFRYPLALPVANADYPCPGAPGTFEEAQKAALSRVTYPAPAGWDQGFTKLHDELVALVAGGPGGGAMATRVHHDLPGQPLSPGTRAESPKLELRALDLVYLASLHPAMAQMLGLYFVDHSAALGVGYDYLLLADPTGVLGGSAATALAWLAFTPDATKVDAVLVLDRSTSVQPPIAPPSAARAYALPGTTSRAIDGSLREEAGNAGLWWQLPADTTTEQPGSLVFYHAVRADLGIQPPQAPPTIASYQPVPQLAHMLISEPDPPNAILPPNARNADWPPPPIELHAVDSHLAEGWYSYRIGGQDLFGRRSAPSAPAEWYQWEPPPPGPGEPPPVLPWYHQPPAGHRSIHTYALALLDKAPPQPPLGIEAWALDPGDPWLFEDEPYAEWRKKVGDQLVGLRVSWRWTEQQQLLAPDTREFRLYYQPGRWNALLGRTDKVTAVSGTESEVALDIGDSRTAGVFTKARLRVGNDDFEIVGSQPGAKLRLRVRNIGAHDDVRPAEDRPCTVAIPDKHALWVDTSVAASWARRLAAVPYEPPARIVVDAVRDGSDRALTEQTFAEANEIADVTVTGKSVQLPPGANLAGVEPFAGHLHLWLRDDGGASEVHRIAAYDVGARTVTLETVPSIAKPTRWSLGRPTREYDAFLPAPDVGLGKPFEPSPEEPVVYAQVAVSAADDKVHTKDDPKWPADPLRFGNESRLSPSATVFRVLRKKPDPPELPELGDRRYATPADYHDRSYTTFRFIDPQKPFRVHILRALDDSLFRRDWLIRETRKKLDPVPEPPKPPDPDERRIEHLAFFPDGWDLATRAAAAAAVNSLASGAAYSTLSDSAWTVLALLPGNERQPDRTELEKRDRYMRTLRSQLDGNAAADWFPKSWNAATRIAAAKELNKIDEAGDYLGLSDNALRVLAALPGNEEAFTQVTLEPLAMSDPQLVDQRRPDDDANYAPKGERRAYLDILPGRATNRYFYRALFVDGAQNQGGLSLPGPPVYLRKVEPPRTPAIVKVVGGDRKITLYWPANPEGDIAVYQLYRADRPEAARDLRQMTLIHTQPGAAPPQELLHWTDEPLSGRTNYFYRLAARSASGLTSPPSTVVLARAHDQKPPKPPLWVAGTWVGAGAGIDLEWSPPDDPPVTTIVMRRSGARWVAVSAWLASGVNRFIDSGAIQGTVNRYRLRVRTAAGNVNVDHRELSVDPG
ncbi:MAG TPA: hypothetical protein VGS57_09280 [Thermoanaerobaculia bacterium]|nr:hypothetical protein [Thermoanaerobaculia bacterium]